MTKERIDLALDALTAKVDAEPDGSRQERVRSAVDSLKAELTRLRLNNDRVVMTYAERDDLVGQQIQERKFVGPLHDQYHLVSLTLNADIDNLFASAKTLLNRLALLWGTALPHVLRRRVRSGSFGEFLNSLNVPDTLAGQHEPLRMALVREGRRLDAAVGEYRDKYIEHLQDVTSSPLLSTSPVGVRRLHARPLETGPTETFPTNAPGFIVTSLPEGMMFTLHAAVRSDIHKGAAVKRGDVIGFVSDGGTGHFDTYGSHNHTFMTPGLSAVPEAEFLPLAGAGLVPLSSSPNALTVTGEIEDFLALAVDGLASLI